MAARGAGVRSSERIASPSRPRSKARPRPTVPETTSAIQMMPATTGAGVREPSRTKAKLKISTTTTARKVIVASTSRLRHSMARSLAAIRRACLKKPAGRSAGADRGGGAGDDAGDPSDTRRLQPLVPGLVARLRFVRGAHRLGAEAAGADLVAHHPPPPQDDHLIGDGRGPQPVLPQPHHPPRGPLAPDLLGQQVGARRIERGG